MIAQPWKPHHQSAGPSFAVQVAGRDISERVTEASVTYSASDGGTSDAEFSATSYLASATNARVDIDAGYGSLEDLFDGEIVEPYDDPWGEPSQARALGPFNILNEQKFSEQTSYDGWTLGRAILDITKQASMPRGSVEIRGGQFALQGDTAKFAMETTLGSALQALLESANYVGFDVPGFRRIYMQKPRPNENGAYAERLDETDYLFGAFTARTTTRNLYSGVRVFRKGEGGSTDASRGGVYAYVPVEIRGPHRPRKRRIYDIPDFAGTQEEAWKEARRWAVLLQKGGYECALSGIDPRPHYRLWDNLYTQVTEERYEGGRFPERYLVDYDWQISGQIVQRITTEGYPMDVSGEGVRVRERKLPTSVYVPRGTDAVVVR